MGFIDDVVYPYWNKNKAYLVRFFWIISLIMLFSGYVLIFLILSGRLKL
jgi:hypothetical protein